MLDDDDDDDDDEEEEEDEDETSLRVPKFSVIKPTSKSVPLRAPSARVPFTISLSRISHEGLPPSETGRMLPTDVEFFSPDDRHPPVTAVIEGKLSRFGESRLRAKHVTRPINGTKLRLESEGREGDSLLPNETSCERTRSFAIDRVGCCHRCAPITAAAKSALQ